MDLLGAFPLRPPRLEVSWAEVLSMVYAELGDHPEVGIDKMFFGGFSLGGHMAAWTALQLPSPCAGVILLSGVVLGSLSCRFQALPRYSTAMGPRI